jgi:hypothetical protein
MTTLSSKLEISRVDEKHVQFGNSKVRASAYLNWLILVKSDNFRIVAQSSQEGYCYIPVFGAGFYMSWDDWQSFVRDARLGKYDLDRLPQEKTSPSPDDQTPLVAVESSPDKTKSSIIGEGLSRYHV